MQDHWKLRKTLERVESIFKSISCTAAQVAYVHLKTQSNVNARWVLKDLFSNTKPLMIRMMISIINYHFCWCLFWCQLWYVDAHILEQPLKSHLNRLYYDINTPCNINDPEAYLEPSFKHLMELFRGSN